MPKCQIRSDLSCGWAATVFRLQRRPELYDSSSCLPRLSLARAALAPAHPQPRAFRHGEIPLFHAQAALQPAAKHRAETLGG